jgi:acid stress-induced BolA-like protein IbaG/YrbA
MQMVETKGWSSEFELIAVADIVSELEQVKVHINNKRNIL